MCPNNSLRIGPDALRDLVLQADARLDAMFRSSSNRAPKRVTIAEALGENFGRVSDLPGPIAQSHGSPAAQQRDKVLHCNDSVSTTDCPSPRPKRVVRPNVRLHGPEWQL